MGRPARIALLVLPLACGARTALLPGGPGDTGSGGSGGGGGGTTPLAVACNAALLDGAPTPTQGYCTTRANQAAVAGPRVGPQIVWSVTPFPITSPEDYLPAETVVDATGRAYVAINLSPQAPAGAENQLFALDDDGTVAWTSSAYGYLDQLTLDREGRLWFPQGGAVGCGDPNDPCSSELVALSSDGTQVAMIAPSGSPSVSGFELMAIASDGTFFVASPYSLARLATDGTVLWETQAVFGETTSIVVGPDDGVVAGGVAYDSAGEELWTGPSSDVAAINAQGQVVGLSADDQEPLSLVTLGAGGMPVATGRRSCSSRTRRRPPASRRHRCRSSPSSRRARHAGRRLSKSACPTIRRT